MSAAPTSESQVVTGQVIGIIQKGVDKWQVAVQPPDQQYTRNLWTKDQTLVAQLSQMIGSTQLFMCGVSHYANQQGQPRRSLWINGVGPGAAQSVAAAPPSPQTAPGPAAPGEMQTVGQVMGQQFPPIPQQWPPQQWPPQPVTPQQYTQVQQQAAQQYADPKQPLIHRQTASKVAVHLMQYLPPEVPRTYDTFLTLCERLVRYYDHGTPPTAPTPPPQDDGYQQQYGDEDIPF